MKSAFKRLMQDKSGATAIEYALVAGMFAVASVGAWQSFGKSSDEMYAKIAEAIYGATSKH